MSVGIRATLMILIVLSLGMTVFFNVVHLSNENLVGSTVIHHHLSKHVTLEERMKIREEANEEYERQTEKLNFMVKGMWERNEAEGVVPKHIDDYDSLDFSHLLPLAVIGWAKVMRSKRAR